MKLRNAAQCKQLDQLAIESGIPSLLLMKKAGYRAFEHLKARLQADGTIAVVCGLGNNAGDGYVLANLAILAGYSVKLVQVGDANKLKGDALQTYQELLALEPEFIHSEDLSDLTADDWIVDALFGIGLDRPIVEEFAEAVQDMNRSFAKVMALDIPSGLSADTGNVFRISVLANVTVTFISHKFGLLSYEGKDLAGEVIVETLDVPPAIADQVGYIADTSDWSDLKHKLPERKHSSHKGTFGTALLIGGDSTMLGAIHLSALACLRMGAGLTKVFSREEHASQLSMLQPEIMAYADLTQWRELHESASALAIGPGLDQTEWGKSLFDLVSESDKTKVLDADALNLLAENPNRDENRVLTPHPKEAARLLGGSVSDVQMDRLAAVKAIQQKYGGVVLLKGTGTLVFDGENCFLVNAGNSGMSVGGMGDVLTGMIASLLAQGLSLMDATILSAQLHAEAGDFLAHQQGKASLIPSDLIEVFKRFLMKL